MVCRPPGPLCDFFNDDTLLSCFPDDRTSLAIQGDFSIHPEQLHSSEHTCSPHLTSGSPPLHSPTEPATNLTLSSQGPVVPGHSKFTRSLYLTITLRLSLSHEVHHLYRPYTSHSHHRPQSEITLSLWSLLNYSFLTTFHRSVLFNVH